MQFAFLTPAEGAEHRPSTKAGPWTYTFDGALKSIFEPDGVTPRPIPIDEANHAVAFFTPRDALAEMPCLVEMDVHEGELELRLAGEPAAALVHNGKTYSSVEELVEAIQGEVMDGAEDYVAKQRSQADQVVESATTRTAELERELVELRKQVATADAAAKAAKAKPAAAAGADPKADLVD